MGGRGKHHAHGRGSSLYLCSRGAGRPLFRRRCVVELQLFFLQQEREGEDDREEHTEMKPIDRLAALYAMVPTL